MNIDTFNQIKKQFGDCGSWAIWGEKRFTKSNMGDLLF